LFQKVLFVDMYRVGNKKSADLYMNKFRTNLCTKRRCRKSKCFDAHSLSEKRRVPIQGHKGLFNYIPIACPEWEKNRKCIFGDSCPRAHGYFEVIFHPLLYKTKMCSYSQINGVCRKNGMYCARAHKETEIRSLVKIFGKKWKRHYDLSLRKSCTRKKNESASKVDKSVGHKEVGLYNSEIIQKYLEGFPSDMSEIFRKLTLKERSGQFYTKSNINKNRSPDVNNNSDSGSLLSASLSDMLLYDKFSTTSCQDTNTTSSLRDSRRTFE